MVGGQILQTALQGECSNSLLCLGLISKCNIYFLPIRKCDVLNRGLSGYNSRWAKIVLPRLISTQNSADNSNIAAVTVFFGANDCALEGTSLV